VHTSTGNFAYWGGSQLNSNHDFLITVEKDIPVAGQTQITIYMDGVQLGQTYVTGVIGSMAGKPWAVGAGWQNVSARDKYLIADIHRLGFFKEKLALSDVWPEQRLNATVRATLTTVRNGEDARMDNDHSCDRAGFGFNYGDYFGGA
jgi:hypothetical protein